MFILLVIHAISPWELWKEDGDSARGPLRTLMRHH
jgi:hypothetical protein